MTIFRGTVLDAPEDPFRGGTLRADEDLGLLVRDGVIVERGPAGDLLRAHPDETVEHLEGGLVLPGFVDTHVHFPQVRVIGGLGMPLLDWLERWALPEEARFVDPRYAASVAGEFVHGVLAAGTTTALVFGAHFAPAVDELFLAAERAGLRVTSGLVVSDRMIREDLLTTPEAAYDEGLALARRWHGSGRNRYAVIPRFSLSCTDPLLESCAALVKDVAGSWFTSHVNENVDEIATVARLFDLRHYVETYDKHDLLGPSSVLAHNVHPTDHELTLLANRGATVAHCPTSNSALGSGMFPLARHVAHGVPVALGSDVGGGTGFSLLKEGLQAHFVQQLLGELGYQLTPDHLLYLATTAGARALGMPDVGHLGVGQRFDAQWVRPAPDSTLDVGLRNARDARDALAKAFTLGTPADIASVWIEGERVRGPARQTSGEL